MLNVFVAKPASAWRPALPSRHRVEVGADARPVLLYQSCKDPICVIEKLQWGAELFQPTFFQHYHFVVVNDGRESCHELQF